MRNPGNWHRLFTALFVALLLVPQMAQPAHAADKLCVQLKWFHQSQFAGFYTAEEEGYYREEGIDVRFLEGGPKTDWQKRMLDQSCPVGVTNPYEILMARESGTLVKAVAAIDQVSPIVIFTLKKSGIWSPRQLRGKSLALVPTGEIHVTGMLMKVGLTLEDLRLAPFSPDMSRLYSGEVDAWSGYNTTMVLKARRDGHEINVIHPLDYGIEIYDDVIYVREELIKRSPDLVQRFVRATLRGWMKAVQEPETGARHTMPYTRSRDSALQLEILRRTIPYVHTGEAPIGWMEESIWDDIASLTLNAGLVNSDIKANEVFTNRFIPALEAGSPN